MNGIDGIDGIDGLATALLEQAKRFLEIARTLPGKEGEFPFCVAALLSGFSALEAHVNALAEELAERPGRSLLDRSILLEKEISRSGGKHVLTKSLKMYRLEDRIEFIIKNFSSAEFPPPHQWWGQFSSGTKLRNDLVHPKGAVALDVKAVERSLFAIIELLNYIYLAVFSKGHPSYNRGIHSKLAF